MRDAADGILYVGKAVNLHNRVRSYFRENIGRGPAIDQMVRLIARFEYIVTDSELEALVLENNLIKEHSPKYNTLLKDDKTYPYIKVTLGEPFPRILFSRSMKKDKSKYFGPYTSAAAVKDTIELLNKLYQLRTCNRNLPRDIGLERPCLNYHIKQCLAPCQGYVDQQSYRKQVEGALEFLNGNYAPILKELEQKMKKAAEELEFEEAARFRDLYTSVKSVAQKQKITDSDGEDKDIIAMYQEGTEAVVQVFFVRDGKLIGREHYYMTHVSELPGEELFGRQAEKNTDGTPEDKAEKNAGGAPEDKAEKNAGGATEDKAEKNAGGATEDKKEKDTGDQRRKEEETLSEVRKGAEAEYGEFQEARRRVKAEVLRQFLQQFYAGTPFIPREIMLQYEVEDQELIEKWLGSRKGSRVYLRVPRIGSKEKLVELAAQNAKLILSQDREHLKREEGRTIGAVKEIAAILGLPGIERMEAFDISNTNGFENVASMVVFEKGKPKPSDYRKFRIKTVAGPDDYACMREALERRFTHGLEEAKELKEKGMEESFGSFTRFPDLLMMDGGRGQVNIALEVLKELQIHVPVCGMVKDDNHRTRGLYFNNVEMPIDTHSEGFKLITRVQDEAHRFAIEYHRSLRGKAQVRSVLEDIPGVGPSRRKALMRRFGSLEEIKNASLEELLEIPELNEKVAQEILAYFRKV